MHAKWLVLILVCFLPACLPATPNDAQKEDEPVPTSEARATPVPTVPVDAQTRQLVGQYLALRPVLGQFNGGEWNDDVDRWMGRKHAAMLELGTALSGGNISCPQLTELLQQPDHTVQGGDDPLYELIQTLPAYETSQEEAAQFLVYEWRGVHDFLFFVCENGRITGSDWWYAGE